MTLHHCHDCGHEWPDDDLEPVAETEDDDWAPHDLGGIAADIIAGTLLPTLPTVLAVEGHLPLLYPVLLHLGEQRVVWRARGAGG